VGEEGRGKQSQRRERNEAGGVEFTCNTVQQRAGIHHKCKISKYISNSDFARKIASA
jgi:hypothetical protein